MNSWFDNSVINPQGVGLNSNVNFNNNNRWNISTPAPHYEVIQVSGENGVDAFPMGPNSSVLLADLTAPIIWLVRTDGAGYKNMKIPYDITPHKATTPIDLNGLEQRIQHLEEVINAKQQPNNKQSRKQQQPATDSTD